MSFRSQSSPKVSKLIEVDGVEVAGAERMSGVGGMGIGTSTSVEMSATRLGGEVVVHQLDSNSFLTRSHRR